MATAVAFQTLEQESEPAITETQETRSPQVKDTAQPQQVQEPFDVIDKHGNTVLTVPASQVSDQTALQVVADVTRRANDTAANLTQEGQNTLDRPGNTDNDSHSQKRKYNKILTTDADQAIRDRLKACEYQARVGYLLSLRISSEQELVDFNFSGITGSQAEFIKDYCRGRIVGNGSTWQHRALDRIIEFIKDYMDEHPLFAQYKDMKLIHSEMKRVYDPHLFVELFDFCKGHLDIAGSGPNVQKWCRALFVEITSSAKRHVDWLMMGPSRPTEATSDGRPVNDREWFINRWKNVATARSWDSIRCDPTEIKRVPKSQKKNYVRKAKRQFLSVDNDPDTYIPSDAE